MKSSLGFLARMIACLVVMIIALQARAEVAPPNQAALEKARVINTKCLSCHTAAAIEHPPSPGLNLSKLRTAILDPDALKNADHGQFACTKCHTEGYTDYPHAADAKSGTATCADCHAKKADKIQAEFDKSVHAKPVLA